jgi:hypothetical protein
MEWQGVFFIDEASNGTVQLRRVPNTERPTGQPGVTAQQVNIRLDYSSHDCNFWSTAPCEKFQVLVRRMN